MPTPLFPGHRFLAIVTLLCATMLDAADRQPNVLFIAVDDLRPELACYGQTQIQSPNIDRLASRGLLFERSYCMVPTCGASRASLMTGVRPARDRFVNYLAWAEKDAPGVTTLNTHFRQNGYKTLSLGKVFHHRTDSLAGWSEPPWRPSGGMTWNLPENAKLQQENAQRKTNPKRGPAFEGADVPDGAYPDGRIAAKAVEELARLAKTDQPWFLAVGFLKPHLPFNCPKKYWDLYDAETIDIPDNYFPPQDAPEGAVHSFGELRAYAGIPSRGILSRELARQLIHGYYACVSYTDAQIGKVLHQLDRLKLSNDTIIVLWGDHGWNLGEHTMWCKHSTFETSMHAPLIVSVPGVTSGQKTRGLTEFIDIYPSLCELAGLPQPAHLQGRSFVPLLTDPAQPWKSSAIGRYQSGDTIRTDRYRFTQYSKPPGRQTSRMLYDHQTDPNENVNIAERKEATAAITTLQETLLEQMGKPND